MHNAGRGGAFPKYEFLYCCEDRSCVSVVPGMEPLAGANEHWAGPRARFGWQVLAALWAPVLSSTPNVLSLISAFPGHPGVSYSGFVCPAHPSVCHIPCCQTAFAHRPHVIRAGHSFQSHTSLHVRGISAYPWHSTGANGRTRVVGGCYWRGFTGAGEEKNWR